MMTMTTTRRLALVLVMGMVAAGCESARGDGDRAAALEKRVAELEQALAASPAPAATPSPEASLRPAPAQPRARAARAPVRRPSATRPAPQPAGELNRPDTWAAADVSEARPREQRPRPEPRPVIVAAGTRLALALETPLSSAESRVGDRVTARVQRAEDPDGDVALPGGAVLHGRVVDVQRPGRVKGNARLSVVFDEIVVRGRGYAVDTTTWAVEAEGSGKRDAKLVGGGALAGGVIGAIAGGKGGFGKGVLVGAGAGTGAVLATRGNDVELPAGSTATVSLRSRLVL